MAQDLKAYNVVATVDVNPEVVDSLGCTEWTAYDADEVDAVLAEKDNEIERLDDLAHAHNIELLRKENLIAEQDAEIRRLKRALWLVRAERATAKQAYYDVLSRGISSERVEMYDVWNNVERKCRAKAEAYK